MNNLKNKELLKLREENRILQAHVKQLTDLVLSMQKETADLRRTLGENE